MSGLKKLWKFLRVKLNITITPPPEYRVKSFSMRRIVPVIVLIIIICTISTLGYLYQHYYSSYTTVREELEKLRGVRAENRELKKETYALSRDTRDLNEELASLQEQNREIEHMVDVDETGPETTEDSSFDLKLTSVFSYNENFIQQGVPVGGNEMQLYYQDPRELVEQMQNSIESLQQEIPEQRKGMEDLEGSVEEHNEEKAATPSIWPLVDKGEAYITSNFGWRSDPFTGEQEHHEGLDIGAWYNTPVLATAYGEVEFAGFKNGYGDVVYINHGFGYKTIYAHLNQIEVSEGEDVRRGEVIARSGNTGRSKGPHLHYEVRVNGVPEDPLEYINNEEISKEEIDNREINDEERR
ncbi:MAG: peptidoglycan DD-metalloendopeptidase family protein [Halanaerobiaceae bacterium]